MDVGSVKVEPSLIGQRVTLRLRDPEGGYRDLVGVLHSLTSIKKRNGEVIEFDPTSVAIIHHIKDVVNRAGKGAPLSKRIAELEELSTRTWPPSKVLNLGLWQVRISDGVTYRANSVLVLGPGPFGDSGLEIEHAVTTIEKLYQEANLFPVFHCVTPLYSELKDYLLAKGWSEKIDAAFLISDIDDPKENTATLKGQGFELLIERSPSSEFLSLHGDQNLESIMKSYPALYISIRNRDEIIATARVAVENSWAILTRLFVAPSHRRQGLAEEMMLASFRAAWLEGADKMCLQLDRSNSAASALYQKLGFRIHHTYSFIEKSMKVVKEECAC